MTGVVTALLTLALAAAAHAAPTQVSCANLQTAVNGATAGEVLQLPKGTCQTNLTITDTAAFTLEGATGGGTILEPQTTKTGSSIIFSNVDVHFTLSGLELTGSHAPALALGPGNGEAVTVKGDVFAGDETPDVGGAISVYEIGQAANQPTVITGNVFANDSSSGGGAVAWNSGQPLVLSNNKFTADSAIDAGIGGGGIYAINATASTNPVVISGNTFGGPTAAAGDTTAGQGGGAYIWLVDGQPLTVTGNTFEHDRVTGAAMGSTAREGGGLFLGLYPGHGPYPVTQSHNTFAENSIDETEATGFSNLAAGGAGEWISGLRVTSTADRFVGNRVAVNDGAPPEGGGVGAIAAAPIDGAPAEPAAFTGRDDLFTGNSTAAGGWGGGIYVGAPTPDCPPGPGCPGSAITLDDSTVVGNHVDAGAGGEGGALWGSLHDILTVNNSIIFGNAPKPEISWFGSHPPVFAYSDVCTESGGPTVSGVGNICKDPKLNPGGVETLGVSPTIAKGSVALVPAGLKTDLAGNARITPGFSCTSKPPPPHVDMGAFEALIPPPPCPSPPPNVVLLSTKLVDKHGKAAVKLRCRKAPCVGTLTLSHRKLKLGRAHFRIRAAKTVTIEVKLSAGALAKLGRKTFVAVTITLRLTARETVAHGTLKLPKHRR